MKDSDKKILLVLLAVAILALSYMYVFKSAKSDIDTLNGEIDTLQVRLDDLTAKEKLKDQYLAETEEYNAQFDEILAYYPADLNQETTVMFVKGVEEQLEFEHKNVSLGQETQFYVLGQGTNEDAVVVEGEETSADEQYVCTSAAYPISYQGTYSGLKDYLNYIASYKYRMNISSVNISYDQETGMCNGSVTLNAYAISGPDRTPDTVTVDVPNGVDNIFVGGNGAVSSSTTSYKYDDNNGAEIETDHNLTILLNNANNDTASGIILAADEKDEETYVTSSDNEAVDVKISVYAADGKNFISYEIGDASYEKELLTDDVTIYVKSSDRVDTDDQNGVNVTVSNTTALSVFFKVVDDDATSPRFKVVNKSGVVKVY